MNYSYTISDTTTFTITHARHMGAKVVTDLKRMQRFYGDPSDSLIKAFEEEIIALLKAGYLETVTYGFRCNGNWIEPTLRYTAQELAGLSAGDDDPGRIRPGSDINNAFFYSYLIRNSNWWNLLPVDREAFESQLSLHRGSADEPGVIGYFSSDRTYSSGGRALNRASVRSF